MSGQSSEIFALARNAEGIHWTQPFRNHFETSVTGADTPSLDLDTDKYGAYFVGFSTNMDGCEVYADVDCTTTVAGLFSFESPASGLPKLICFKAADRNITKIYLKFNFLKIYWEYSHLNCMIEHDHSLVFSIPSLHFCNLSKLLNDTILQRIEQFNFGLNFEIVLIPISGWKFHKILNNCSCMLMTQV